MQRILSAALLLLPTALAAEVVKDGSLPFTSAGNVPLTGNDYTIDASAGYLNGGNLFHSFTTFNIEAGNSATFTGGAGIDNVVTRITGSQASTIDGSLVSTIPDANFWLLNPNGVVFGNGSSINVLGSFHASSADYLRMQDGARFYVHEPAVCPTCVLTSEPPAAFGFLPETASARGAIDVTNTRLAVPTGEALSLVGGDVNLQAARLTAIDGRIQVVSVAENGEVVYNDQIIDHTDAPLLGNLQVDLSAFDTGQGSQGSLLLQAGNVELNTADTDFSASVTPVRAVLLDAMPLIEEPCAQAAFHGGTTFNFTVEKRDDETRFGLKGRGSSGAIGLPKSHECVK